MNEQLLDLTAEERELLTELLTTSLKEMRVEEHRTRTPSFREHIIRREDVARAVLGKLQSVPASTN